MTTPLNGKGAATTAPPAIPPAASTPLTRIEFLRLPKPGQLCPYTGLSRSFINSLVLPTKMNGRKPPVRSFVLRQKGAKTGVRLVSYDSLRNFILAHAEGGAEVTGD
jgi:hypothetical protein